MTRVTLFVAFWMVFAFGSYCRMLNLGRLQLGLVPCQGRDDCSAFCDAYPIPKGYLMWIPGCGVEGYCNKCRAWKLVPPV